MKMGGKKHQTAKDRENEWDLKWCTVAVYCMVGTHFYCNAQVASLMWGKKNILPGISHLEICKDVWAKPQLLYNWYGHT